ncbi:MAG: iron-containing alcohol dehydrogenase [Chloroflexi bacterium]|nr:iron-containing alcohol dehydrogenase [Chloroflexota bacterium]
MSTIWPLPQIEVRDLATVEETRPVALLTGTRAWEEVNTRLNLPIAIQAEPNRVDRDYLDSLAAGLPEDVGVVYGVGGGLVSDVAKYIGWARKLPSVIVPTSLSQDGFFTALVAARVDGTVNYVTTGPANMILIDWEVIRYAPRHVRGAAIIELLTIVTGLLDWRYASERNRNPPSERFMPWAASLMAGIAQQAFRIANDVGEGKVEALRNLLDLVCMEVQLTNQLGHNRAQEGSEQIIAYALEPRATRDRRPMPYADLVGPSLLVAMALHNQDINNIRDTLMSAGLRLGQARPEDISQTIRDLPQYVRQHDLPFTILHDLEPTADQIAQIMATTGLAAISERPI